MGKGAGAGGRADTVDPTRTITKNELGRHNKPGDAWVAIHGAVSITPSSSIFAVVSENALNPPFCEKSI
jgi:hypothetical protein